MRTFRAVLAALALLAALPATASAKELAAVKACGASGCADVTALAGPAVLEGGQPTAPPTQGAAFYRLRFTVRTGGERAPFTTLYAPSLRLVRGDDGTWMVPPATTRAALDRLVAGRRPLPASRLPVAARPPAPPRPVASADGLPSVVWGFAVAGVLAAAAALLLLPRALGGSGIGRWSRPS